MPRKIFTAALALIAAVAVGACQPLSFPFMPDEEEKAAAAPAADDRVPEAPSRPAKPAKPRFKVMIPPVTGAPRIIGIRLSKLVTAHLNARRVRASMRGMSYTTYLLHGSAQIAPLQQGGATIQLQWQLVSPEGLPAGSFADQVYLPRAPRPGAWPARLPAAINDVVARAAAQVDALIQEADQGPPAVPTGTVAATPLPGSSGAAPRQTDQRSAPRVAVTASNLPPVTVLDVDGAPGDGGPLLAEAMRDALSRARVPVVDDISDRSYLLLGDVFVADDTSGFPPVSITWTLMRPDGEAVGVVSYTNRLAGTAMDPHWGPLARTAVARGAQDLVSMLQQAGAPGGPRTNRRF